MIIITIKSRLCEWWKKCARTREEKNVDKENTKLCRSGGTKPERKKDKSKKGGRFSLYLRKETGNVCVILEIDGWEVICDDVITTWKRFERLSFLLHPKKTHTQARSVVVCVERVFVGGFLYGLAVFPEKNMYFFIAASAAALSLVSPVSNILFECNILYYGCIP